jgi:O-antigen/teichoic acid export membrane protein
LKQLLYRGIFWRGLNYLTVFLVAIAIARLFKAGESGVINYLINNLALLIVITSFSLESATGFYSAKEEIGQPAIIGISLLMSLASLLVNIVLIRLLFPLSNLIWVSAAMYCFGIVLMNYFTALFYSHYEFRFPNAVVIAVNCVIIFIASVFPGYLLRDSGELFLNIYFGSFLLTGLILTCRYVFTHGKKVKIPVLKEWQKIFRYAAVAMLTNLVFFLVYRVDYWFVNRNCTDQELGNYIQVSKLGQIFMLLPAIISGMVFTRTAREKSHDHIRELQLLSRLLFSAYVIILLVPAIFGYWLFPLVYGETFTRMYLPFLLLIPGILSLATLSLVAALNAGEGRVIVNLTGGLVALAVIVAGNFMFSRRYGIYAAAAVSSAGYICYQVYVMWRLVKEHEGLHILDFFKLRYNDLTMIKKLFAGKENNQPV